jgi:DNA-binding response OmpR family regulator
MLLMNRETMPQKILIVEDEPNIVFPLQFLMERNGYRVAVASTGEDAMSSIRSFVPDLILLDITLPGVDGFEVCQAVRNIPEQQHTKIIFLSAMGRDMDIAKGMAIGGDAYITKPFSNADVVKKVRDLLNDKNQ